MWKGTNFQKTQDKINKEEEKKKTENLIHASIFAIAQKWKWLSEVPLKRLTLYLLFGKRRNFRKSRMWMAIELEIRRQPFWNVNFFQEDALRFFRTKQMNFSTIFFSSVMSRCWCKWFRLRDFYCDGYKTIAIDKCKWNRLGDETAKQNQSNDSKVDAFKYCWVFGIVFFLFSFKC